MDYILADRYCVPEGNRWHFTERVLYLEDSRLCFTRPGGDLPVSPLPSARNGFVTFCCFNNMAKLNDAVIDVWCDILRTVPSSRMLLKTKALAEAGTVQELAARFGGRGVDPRRLTLEGASPRHEYFMAYGRADIALDPFPYTGATTSMDALWMGVPVITLAGDRMAARQGVAIMTHAGLPDWIAKNCDQYLALAQSHARDLSALATVRSELRGRL
jgi:predicted O-linked N-acetylglucosamine transferase (SPINDLY family)